MKGQIVIQKETEKKMHHFSTNSLDIIRVRVVRFFKTVA